MNGKPVYEGISSLRAWRVAAMVAVLALSVCLPARADEPYGRTRDYDLQNARINLRFDLEQKRVVGEVTHTLAALRGGVTALEFDSVDLSIQGVTVGGKTAKFATTADKLRVTLDKPSAAGEKYVVAIRYEGRPKKGLYFILPDKNYPDRPTQVWTQGEAEDTRFYVPIYDYPDDRTATEMILTVPAKWVTVSNGRLVSVKDATGGMKKWTWNQSEPHSTYLISIVARLRGPAPGAPPAAGQPAAAAPAAPAPAAAATGAPGGAPTQEQMMQVTQQLAQQIESLKKENAELRDRIKKMEEKAGEKKP